MNKLCIFLLVTAMGVVTAAAENGWGLNAAYWDTEDLSDQAGVGATLSIEMIPSVLMNIRGTYFDGFGDEENGDVDLQVVPVELGLVVYQPVMESLNIYGGGGIGYYFMDTDKADVDDEVGSFLNAGLELKGAGKKEVVYGQTHLGLFVEAIYRFVEADAGSADFNLDGLGANAGLMIRW